MPIMIQSSKTKLMCAGGKIARMYCEGDVIYSSGNIVTYMVDIGLSYQEEVDEGESCLSPKTFVPEKTEWTFVGWKQDTTANGNVASELLMGDEPVTLYAVFKQTVTLTTVANSVTSKQNKDRIYNNGAVANPAFTVTNPTVSGATFQGWSSSSSSVSISNSSISNLYLTASTTRYAVFKYPDKSNSLSVPANTGQTYTKTIAGVTPDKYTSAYMVLEKNWVAGQFWSVTGCGLNLQGNSVDKVVSGKQSITSSGSVLMSAGSGPSGTISVTLYGKAFVG